MTTNFTFIRSDKKIIKLYFDDILFVKGLGNYVQIVTGENKKYTYYKSLKELIDSLPNEFMRVHNSYIVNLTNIDSFEDNHLSLKGTKISVAKSYRDCLLTRINNFLL